MRKMNKIVSLEKKTLGTKGKYEALDYVQKNLPSYNLKKKRKKKKKRIKEKVGREMRKS